jgi:hypothetical protein
MTYTTEQIQAIFDERISNITTELKHTDFVDDIDGISYLAGAKDVLTEFKTKFK